MRSNVKRMVMVTNPFILYGYESEAYFCDRKDETRELSRLLENGNNVALIAPRRIGKTGLIQNLFHQPKIQKRYYTFLIDIYATKNMEEMILEMGAGMLASIRPRGLHVIKKFIELLKSLRTGITFDAMGNPSWNVEVGDILQPKVSLDELFQFIESADKPCIIAIDEFQAVAGYKEGNVEAVLRTYIQHCRNANFIFAGSQRTMMGEMFLNPARPFYQSTTMMNIGCIPLDKYQDFAISKFEEAGKRIEKRLIGEIYERFEGVTWYMQRVMNELFSITPIGNHEVSISIDEVISNILRANEFTYQSILFQLPSKQKKLLIAISKAGKAENITSADFIRRYSLSSPSSVQSAIKGLLEKNYVTTSLGVYEVYDKFFALWLVKR